MTRHLANTCVESLQYCYVALVKMVLTNDSWILYYLLTIEYTYIEQWNTCHVCLFVGCQCHDTGTHVSFVFVFCIRFTFHPSIHVCIIKIHYTGRTTSNTTTTTGTTSLNATSMPGASTSSSTPTSSRSTTSLSEPGFLQYFLDLAPYSCLTCRCWTSF